MPSENSNSNVLPHRKALAFRINQMDIPFVASVDENDDGVEERELDQTSTTSRDMRKCQSATDTSNDERRKTNSDEPSDASSESFTQRSCMLVASSTTLASEDVQLPSAPIVEITGQSVENAVDEELDTRLTADEEMTCIKFTARVPSGNSQQDSISKQRKKKPVSDNDNALKSRSKSSHPVECADLKGQDVGARTGGSRSHHSRDNTSNELPHVRRVGRRYRVNRLGVVLYKGHKSYTLMRNVQMGIRTMVGTIEARPMKPLETEDFKTSIKFQFPKRGTERTPPHKFTDFQFKDYCPSVFRSIRKVFDTDPSDYMISLCGDNSLSVLGTPGKSGALFFYSHDMRFVLKTVTKKESKYLRTILHQYYHHVTKYPNTLLTRFYGLHRITPRGGKNVRFVVMNNVFMTSLPIHERYDLKGSTIGRMVTEEEKKHPNCILKDLDITKPVHLGHGMTDLVLEQLKLDTEFLKQQTVMDYSLLLGVYDMKEDELRRDVLPQDAFKAGGESQKEGDNVEFHKAAEVSPTDVNVEGGGTSIGGVDKLHEDPLMETRQLFQQYEGGTASDERLDGGKVYFVGIIDILQQWDTRKQMEQFLKAIRYQKADISVADPALYAERFMSFMKMVFVFDIEEEKDDVESQRSGNFPDTDGPQKAVSVAKTDSNTTAQLFQTDASCSDEIMKFGS